VPAPAVTPPFPKRTVVRMSASAVASPPATAGRHRRSARGPLVVVVDAVGRLGSLVTLAALLVVAGAVGGLADGMPATDGTVTTATLGGR
jgi:hypothetical protein